MNCRNYQDWMRDEIDGDLDAASRRRLGEHLRGCRRCAEHRIESARTVERFRNALLPVPRIDVVARVMTRIYETLPGLLRAGPITERQFALSIGTATAVAAAAAAGILLLAPGAMAESPLIRLALWIPKLLATAGTLVLETVQFLVVSLAAVLRALGRLESEMKFLEPLRILLLSLLVTAVLGTTMVAVRRDLARSGTGGGRRGGKP